LDEIGQIGLKPTLDALLVGNMLLILSESDMVGSELLGENNALVAGRPLGWADERDQNACGLAATDDRLLKQCC